MNVLDVIDRTSKLKTFLIGFYGGGNYGDELLLEVLANLYDQRGSKQLSVAYQDTSNFNTFHKDFGYELVPMRQKLSMIRAFRKNDSIVIGGGGLWGLDMNLNVLLLSAMLYVAGKLLRKEVYLIGVGYYASTTRMGHIAAWFAAKGATHIVARDKETLKAFSRYSNKVSLDKDIAWNLSNINLAKYHLSSTTKMLTSYSSGKVIITIRRFKGEKGRNYVNQIEQLIHASKDVKFTVLMMEPKENDSDGYLLLKSWMKKYENVQAFDYSYNPIELYLALKHISKFVSLVIAPQFHVILTSKLANAPFYPIAYDNKVSQLLEGMDIPPIKLSDFKHDEVIRSYLS